MNTPLDTNKGEPMKTLPEIVDGVVDWAESGRTKLGRPDSTVTPLEAQEAIAKELMGIIGEDEPFEFKDGRAIPMMVEEAWKNGRNKLLAEQRARLTAFIGYKEK